VLENLVALVVEDDAHCLVVMSKTLKELGVRFKRNTTGAHVIEQIHTMYPRPDFILLNMDLPDGDAYAIAHHIQSDAALRQIPVIGVGDSDSTNIRKMQSNGFSGLVAKPIMRSQLGALLRQVLAGEQVWPATV
jgi:CheY-like chemotaxis protein